MNTRRPAAVRADCVTVRQQQCDGRRLRCDGYVVMLGYAARAGRARESGLFGG